MRVIFANNIEKDILEALNVATTPDKPITNNYIKCSKSVVPNAFYYISKGEQVEFILGNMATPEKGIITHCWIEHNGQVMQTHVPDSNIQLFANYSITLSLDIKTAKEEIKDLVEFILN